MLESAGVVDVPGSIFLVVVGVGVTLLDSDVVVEVPLVYGVLKVEVLVLATVEVVLLAAVLVLPGILVVLPILVLVLLEGELLEPSLLEVGMTLVVESAVDEVLEPVVVELASFGEELAVEEVGMVVVEPAVVDVESTVVEVEPAVVEIEPADVELLMEVVIFEAVVDEVDEVHSSSSSFPGQSLSPSQSSRIDIHSPVSHWNSSILHKSGGKSQGKEYKMPSIKIQHSCNCSNIR